MNTNAIRGLAAKHHGELGGLLAAGEFDTQADGRIHVPRMGLMLAGTYRVMVNGADPGVCSNIFVNEGLTDLLAVAFKNGAQHATYYLSLFSGDVSPLNTWTAANYAANATEITGAYSQTNRPTCQFGTVTTPSVGNEGNLALFTFTGTTTVRGAGLHTVNGKGSGGGKLYSAGRFDFDRTVQAGDNLSLEYTIDASDGSTP